MRVGCGVLWPDESGVGDDSSSCHTLIWGKKFVPILTPYHEYYPPFSFPFQLQRSYVRSHFRKKYSHT